MVKLQCYREAPIHNPGYVYIALQDGKPEKEIIFYGAILNFSKTSPYFLSVIIPWNMKYFERYIVFTCSSVPPLVSYRALKFCA